MEVWIDRCTQHDSYIMHIKLSHPRVLLHTTCRWAQSDWQLLFRAILTCMFGTNYTPGTLWHCEVTSRGSLIWWGEQSTLLYSIWCKEYFCVSCVCLFYEPVPAVAHIPLTRICLFSILRCSSSVSLLHLWCEGSLLFFNTPIFIQHCLD